MPCGCGAARRGGPRRERGRLGTRRESKSTGQTSFSSPGARNPAGRLAAHVPHARFESVLRCGRRSESQMRAGKPHTTPGTSPIWAAHPTQPNKGGIKERDPPGPSRPGPTIAPSRAPRSQFTGPTTSPSQASAQPRGGFLPLNPCTLTATDARGQTQTSPRRNAPTPEP